ncbi:MAG: serpin family protein [Saprospiraceae bacterium]|nr:serpin family protein [Saprospiraceae bacterium]MBK8373189.1 serpin family protein [Saprospiraceae bacterium]MBK8853968.1 serpin family protein [Saprospiraceae bacterium]
MKNVLLILGFIFMFSCTKQEDSQNVNVDINSVVTLTDKQNQFAWDVFQEELKKGENKNILISPLSIQTALTMAVNGAGGKTLEEMKKMLYSDNYTNEDLNKLYQSMIEILTQKSGHPTLLFENGYFYDLARITVKENFKKVLKDHYDCIFEEENFSDADGAKNNINAWVEEKTNGKIDKIVEAIKPLDVAFLINALYFKADWANGFSQDLTYQANFNKADGKEFLTKFVNADRNFSYAVNDKFIMADIPFKDSTYSVSFISRKNDYSTPPDVNDYKKLLEQVKYDRAFVAFPKMKLEYKTGLIPSLQNLGMLEAFKPYTADFSTMGTSTLGNIYISQVEHKSVLEIDEKGAEGAAVTSIGFSVTSAPPSLIFDHPYFLVLRHIGTGSIIFMGYVGYEMN